MIRYKVTFLWYYDGYRCRETASHMMEIWSDSYTAVSETAGKILAQLQADEFRID